MLLLKLRNGKYAVVQDDYQRTAGLMTKEDRFFTTGTLDEIANSRWYGWEQLNPTDIHAYQKEEMLLKAKKLKSIKHYCAKVMQ